jgi:hypothetical protein
MKEPLHEYQITLKKQDIMHMYATEIRFEKDFIIFMRWNNIGAVFHNSEISYILDFSEDA